MLHVFHLQEVGFLCVCVRTIIPYPRTDTHLLLSDEDIKVLYYSSPFYEHVPVSINYPLQSGAPPGSWPLIRVVEWMDRGTEKGGWLNRGLGVGGG